MIFLFLPPASAFSGGDGSETNPYQISNVYELQDMNQNLTANYVLINDIDASATSEWNDGAGFEPVGNYKTHLQFTGSLKGNNHSINDLYINRSSSFYVGLFGYTGQGSKIKYVGLTEFNVTGNYYVGGLAGYNNGGIISDSHSTGEITGRNNVGGLIGHNDGGTITDLSSSGEITGYLHVGGIVGYNDNGVVSCSYSDVNITQGSEVGGLIGVNNHGSRITSSHSTGNISGYDTVGGLVGGNCDSEVINSYSTGNVTGDMHIGGLVGTNGWSGHDGCIIDSYSTGDVSGNGRIGGLVGRNWYGEIENSYSTGEVTGYYFVGGLLGYNEGGTLSRTNSTGMVIGDNHVGGLVGWNYNDAIIANSYSMGEVIGNYYIGGLVGQNSGSIISDSYSRGNVSANNSAGGLVGYNTGSGTISNSDSSGEVLGKERVGGLVGSSRYATTIDSHSIGNVFGVDEVGGLVGHSYQSILENTYSTGAVSGNNMVGGLVGYTQSLGGYKTSIISSSCSSGHVSGNDQVGGFIGSNSLTAINNTYSIGDVIGNDQVGGFIGCNMFGPMTIGNSYSIGEVSGNSRVGGFVGRHWYNATINDSYWNTETSGQSTSAGGEARTIIEMKYPYMSNTYVNWDFENIWSIHPDINDGYPYLRVFIDRDMPSTPTDLSFDKGNFYVNWSWNSGANTDSFNVSVNGIWHNGTTYHYFNDTPLDSHGTSSIVVYAFNKSKNTLSRPVSSSVQLDNNPITITGLSDIEINEGEAVYINADFEDLDGDVPFFNCSRKDLFQGFNNKTGVGSWVTGQDDAGVYDILFEVTDGYGSTDSQCISIIVKDYPEEPEFVFTITDDVDKTSLGSELIYEISLKNTGSIELTNVSIRNPLPSELNFISAPNAKFNSSTKCVIIDLGALSSGESVKFLITTKAVVCGTIINSAIMNCEQHESASCSDKTEVVDNEEIPEFSTIVIPMLIIVGIALVFTRKKE
ncbi:GLUG motif-containing protein [Methanolobus bombayensis]|uniref:GLUG motif-containing protein n=1 Tax=Methanolobus bombayensis TaxID=38023 RepID=UPI001AE496CA|nr:GLUG motif-containing protein [Methanolobus bombayensis]MBP1908511.1 putative repeat protein (TIGR01451 family) [Methanolobus bombayensis]